MTAISNLPRLAALAVLGLASSVAPATADSITTTDGTVIEDVDIETETLAEIIYKSGRQQMSVESEKVLEVSFAAYPSAVDEALAFLNDGDIHSALQSLDGYVDDEIEDPSERRYKWAPAYAAWRVVELRNRLADLDGVAVAAKRVVDRFPDSRYVPAAYLAKASAEYWTDQPEQARTTLDALAALVSSKGLSKRWDLECRLAQIQFDGKPPSETKRQAYAAIATEAGADFPTVAGRAQVALGESFLAEAEATLDSAAAQGLRDEARKVFTEIADDPSADDGALAGAHTGLGDCLFFEGAAANDEAVLKEAAMHYLRVVTLYESQAQYVPKALYFALRTFDLMDNRLRRADMQRELLQNFPDSEWAQRPEVQ